MRRIAIVACLALAVVSSLGGQTAAKGRNGPHPDPDYFVVHDGMNFRRSTEPMDLLLVPPPGSASQTVNKNHSIALRIEDAEHYADDGFYLVLGRLGDLDSIVATASKLEPGPFALNLWFDSNGDGEFFVWAANVSNDVLVALGGDQYALGPQSNDGSLSVKDSTTFYMQGPPNAGSSYTLAQLKSGSALGISANTPVAAWIGICCGGSPGSPATQTATIKSVKVR